MLIIASTRQHINTTPECSGGSPRPTYNLGPRHQPKNSSCAHQSLVISSAHLASSFITTQGPFKQHHSSNRGCRFPAAGWVQHPSRAMLAAWGNLPPLPRAALTSCALMAVGDGVCQCIQANRRAQQQDQKQHTPFGLDLGRTAKFGVIGLTLHGPFFFKGFQWLDAYFGKAATFKNAITKSLVGQVTLFPTYTPAVLLYASLLVDGNSLEQGLERVQQRLPSVLLMGTAYWPVVNMLNFKFVPPHQRVLAVNMCAIAWNAYLSYVSTAPLQKDTKS